MRKIVVNGKTIVIMERDITEEKVDAIVNAANSYLKHGAGVAGAIVRKGGKIIQEESDKIGFVPVGEAVITTAGNLLAKWVIHAVGPRWGEGDEENKLKRAIQSVLKLASKKNFETISIPAISTGIFGFPKEKGTKIIFEEVYRFLKEQDTSLKEVHLCDLNESTIKAYLKAVERM